jgi:hypothetical protein
MANDAHDNAQTDKEMLARVSAGRRPRRRLAEAAAAGGGCRVLICGSRRYRNAAAIARYIKGLTPGTVVIHGGAKGADMLADLYAQQNGLATEAYPADWDTYGKGAGPVRNKQMLDEGQPTEVVAFVADPTNSPGTANMVLQALARGVPVTVNN